MRLGEAVALDAHPPARGVALRVTDTEGGLDRSCRLLGATLSTLPHVTLLHPRNSSGAAAEDEAIAAAGSIAPHDIQVDAITLIEERDDVWHDIARHALVG